MQYNFSSKLNGVSGSATREVLKLLTRPEIISFAGGLPATECLACSSIADTANQILNSNSSLKALQYGATEGIESLRESVVNFSGGVGIKNITKDNALIISGGQQGIDLAFRAFLDKGDTVLVENPTYLAVLPMIASHGAKVVGVKAEDNGICVLDLEQKIKKHKPKLIYVVPTFSNPTGKTYPVKTRKAIANLAKKYNVVVIEDDPYSRLRFEGEPQPALKSFDTSGHVIYISSFSKILSPGLRVGFAIATPEILKKMVIVKQGSDLHTSNLSQCIVDKFLATNAIEKNIKDSLPIYKAKKDTMLKAIKEYMPKSFKHTYPEGGLFIWGEFESSINTVELFKKAIDSNVAYIQGAVFYPKKGEGLNTLRLNYSNVKKEDIERGIKTLGEIFKG